MSVAVNSFVPNEKTYASKYHSILGVSKQIRKHPSFCCFFIWLNSVYPTIFGDSSGLCPTKRTPPVSPVQNIWAADTLPSVDHRLDNFVYDQVRVEPSIETIHVKRETFPLVGVNIKHVGMQVSWFAHIFVHYITIHVSANMILGCFHQAKTVWKSKQWS